jgi:L-lactate dehydrogenase complex protein LldG
MSEFSEYKKEIMDAAHSERISLALTRAIASYRGNVSKALEKFPHSAILAEEVRQIRSDAIDNMEKLAQIACEAIELNKGKAYIAKDGKAALEIVDKIVGKNKLIVKGKSITAHEIELQEHLEAAGNEVLETDLGEFIVQQLHQRPMHVLSPAIHVPKEDVAVLLSKLSGKELPPTDIEKMVATARELLRDKFVKADIGISGANAVAADVGSIFLIENEGNIRLATTLPPIHIAIVGMDKIVPTLSDAFKMVEVAWRYANYTVPSYLSMTSGPSKTGDIEKVITYGAHGPKEFHVIFIDNGRTRLAKNPILKQAMLCLGCGGCLYECPVFSVTAGHFGDKRFAGAGAVWAALAGKKEKAAGIAYTCLACGRCKVRCPMSIDTPAMCLELRKILAENREI